MRRFLSILLLLATGCQSYTVTQRNVFVDDDGFVVTVDYGRSDTDHENTFIAPMTGKEMEFRSRLAVHVELPDGDSFTAWQCMNLYSRGTLYQTDNKKWMFLANGFSCTIYHQAKGDKTKYYEVYRGVVCDTPEIEIEKDDRWRVIPRGGPKAEVKSK